MQVDGPFRTLIDDYGSKTSKQTPEEDVKIKEVVKATEEVAGEKLHMDEDRETGAVSFQTYTTYMAAMGHWSLILILGIVFVAAQLASIVNILWLGWWAGDRFNGRSSGFYMGVYAGELQYANWQTWLS
jgi:ATP-binding cassette subfamily C (CFTR/MRP) protein 1